MKLVKNYDLDPIHFEDQKVEIQNVNFGKAAKPSGFQLLVLLLNDTPMLRTTLSVISEGEDCLKSLITTSSKLMSWMNVICIEFLLPEIISFVLRYKLQTSSRARKIATIES